ncbi:AAA family ATPase [Winogradskyella sp.]|uniref:ATP-dependent nuclease n=1 Tax=Winogradskyella sp. TaxID=1883156 RepID=UPI001B14B285|nr:AAA family ATPase [Winogradskyella sp.]MBO6881828.1 AAA family ATPase [Winogradskyella sp.]
MRYKKFTIHKYKAVENVEVSLRNNLIPIIGINESGKTSILYGILSFDKDNDDFFSGNHLNAENRYEWDSKNHTVSATLEFEDKAEINSIIKDIGITRRHRLYKQLITLIDNNEELKVLRNLDTKEYSITNFHIDRWIEEKLVDEIFLRTPFVLFFDDFTDRVPAVIKFPSNYTSKDYDEETDSERTDWNIYIEEIIFRATNKEKDLNDLLKQDEKIRKGILSDVTDKLNEDIIKEWKQLKILQNQLSEDKINDLELELDYDKDDKGNHVFKFSVIDKNFKGKSRFFTIQERSKGFQWFFNYAIKLKYNSKYYSDFKGAIYLLDEPGSYLHSSAQEELLESLQKISKTNKIIFCTHSQYLLNPDIINISNIRIAQRDDGKINLINFGEYRESTHSEGALSPIYDALNMSLGRHNFPRNENVIITEGITDFYFFNMLKQNTSFCKDINVSILPGASASNLKELISFSIAWSKQYALILDTDDAGNKAYENYKTFFGIKQSENWIRYSDSKNSTKVTLEKMISKTDQKKLKLLTSSQSVKKCISLLYFMDKIKIKDFFQDLDDVTIANFKILENKLSSVLKN